MIENVSLYLNCLAGSKSTEYMHQLTYIIPNYM